jgi:hypothetical protein
VNGDVWNITEAIAISFSVVVAALTYAFGRHRDVREQDRQELVAWQTGVVHEMFQKSGSKHLSFDEIIQRYRSEAQAAKVDVKKKALSPEALRTILCKFVADMIVTQRGNDSYTLRTLSEHNEAFEALTEGKFGKFSEFASSWGALQPLMASSLSYTLNEQQINSVVAGFLISEPNKYTSNDLVIKLSKQLNLDNEQVQQAINSMFAKSKIRARQDGKLSLVQSVIDHDDLET